MSTIDEQKNCTISLAFSQGANSVLSMERNNAVLFSSHRKRGHVLFCRSMYPPSPDKEEKRNRPKADGPLLSIPAANRHGYPTRPHRSSRISIHDPHTGIDADKRRHMFTGCISIHDPRAGIDDHRSSLVHPKRYFNSRPPCGDRQTTVASIMTGYLFQFTTPVRGSTAKIHKINGTAYC